MNFSEVFAMSVSQM